MALTPWNRQEEWYQEMINSGTGKYLPSITAQDSGKVLTVESDGSWGVENVPSDLPAVSGSDKDKYLHTNASTGDVEWSPAPTGLPSVSSTDEGKVLTVNNSGVWVAEDAPSGLPSTTSASAGDVLSLNNNKEAFWATPSSGGGVLVVTDTDGTLDKTWQEIHDATLSGGTVIQVNETDVITVLSVNFEKGTYFAYLGTFGRYTASSASGYPVRQH